jgi:valyl-tRNA synthetase
MGLRTGRRGRWRAGSESAGHLRIDPPELATEYLRWLDEMRDWCLSRQLGWGRRIPIWYGAAGQARWFGPDEAIWPAGRGTRTPSTPGSPRDVGFTGFAADR